MRQVWMSVFCVLLGACASEENHKHEERYAQLHQQIGNLEDGAKGLMSEIDAMARFGSDLLLNQSEEKEKSGQEIYTIRQGISTNRPGDGSDLSTIYISDLSPDLEKAHEEIEVMNPMDSIFRMAKLKHDFVSQVYTNSRNQVSRVYPAYDAINLVDQDLDITSFNFYYEADEKNNPERKPLWLPDPYIDPAGRGWIVSLIAPIYDQAGLYSVLGIDFEIGQVLDPFLEDFGGNYLLVTGKGDIVAGSPQAINQLSFPPLTNHVYREAIRADNFRISDYNLYNSKSAEVREMAQKLLLEGDHYFRFGKEADIKCALAARFEVVDWLLIEILN